PPLGLSLFPYTTLFRSAGVGLGRVLRGVDEGGDVHALLLPVGQERVLGVDVAGEGDALLGQRQLSLRAAQPGQQCGYALLTILVDRKSTRLNSSHVSIS